MGAGAVLEPLVVLTLLFGGTWVNRNASYTLKLRARITTNTFRDCDNLEDIPSHSPATLPSGGSLQPCSQPVSPSLLAVEQIPEWREREIRLGRWRTTLRTPNSRQFNERWFSRVLRKFPFLQEAFYWALLYWVYQLGRAFTAVTLVEGTVHVARQHALQLIRLEQSLGIFWEVPIQRFFLGYPTLLMWINRTYSFIHIPGTILFLVCLYHFTARPDRIFEGQIGDPSESPAGPRLYEARRRTMAMCNLLAFVLFTVWPCMPPRLLSDPDYNGRGAAEAKSYGFADTVHGDGGEGSVWTQNKFCNQYAAMPSLHFGYSLLIGLTVATLPLAPRRRRNSSISLKGTRFSVLKPSWDRVACVAVGLLYPLTILVAIIATANHFVLDAVAGAVVCGIAWHGNGLLLNLLPLEDWFMWCIRSHFAERGVLEYSEGVGEGKKRREMTAFQYLRRQEVKSDQL